MKKLLLSIAALNFCLFTTAQVITVSTLSTGFTRPIGIQNSGLANDDRLFILEKVGRIRIIDRNIGAVTVTPFLNITSRVGSSGNEQGLLGLAFHPDYAINGYFFVDYTNLSGHTVIARYQVSAFPDTAMVNSEQILMTIYQPQSNHNGGNLMFGKDGYLYISMGDGGGGGDQGTGHNTLYGNSQHIDSLLGKILRIDVNNPNPPYYSSPSSNPFYGGNAPSNIPYAGTLPGRDEIFHWGVRNPWRASIDRLTGDKWIGEVGQNAWEEIDFEGRCDTMGKNYGWRCYEGNAAYNPLNCQPQSSYTAPVFVYAHSGGNCSVTGGYVYRGGKEGSLFGKYLFTDYCTGIIWATSPNGSGGWTTTQLTQTNTANMYSYSSWGEDVYGELYLTGDGNGNIYRVRDTACAPVAYIFSPDTVYNCSASISFNAIYGEALTYTWNISGSGWSIASGQGTESVTLNTGTGTGTVNVTVSNGSCNATSNTIYVYTSATFTGLDSAYCANDAPVALVANPPGGTFSGPGISGGSTFDPNIAGDGVHAIVYTFNDNVSTCYFNASNCSFSDTQYVNVIAIPSVSISAIDSMYCTYDPVVTLSGSPSGGTFSGPGVSGNTFNPAAATIGNNTITYSYTDSVTNCSNSASFVVEVFAQPTVSITGADTMYCVYNDTATFTGNPAGGTFSGPGMTGNTFDPNAAGLGFHTITYDYTDSVSGCSNSTSIIIHVDACLGITENSSLVSLTLFPNPNNGEFILSTIVRNKVDVVAEIADALGQVVLSRSLSLGAGHNSIRFNNSLAKGVYFLKINGENVKSSRSFVVK
jgi:glucose/arabinose dehydrogenase